MYRGYKIKLKPNNKQSSKMLKTAGCSRYAYNWVLETEKKNYENGGRFINNCELRRMFTIHKADNPWLYEVSNDALKQSIKDACNAYIRFFKHQAKFPNFKSKRRNHPSFYMDVAKIKISPTHVKLEKIANNEKKNRLKGNWIRLAEHNRIPLGCSYSNPRITFDGLDWWLGVGVEVMLQEHSPSGCPIGIDLGIKSLAVCSDGIEYPNINKTDKIKKIEKQKRRLQRQVSRKYKLNKKGNVYCKTSNIIKLEKQLLKVNHRLTNIRRDNLHQVTSSIIAREPSAIIMEDLNVIGMIKNKNLAKSIQEQLFGEFYQQMKYKCEWNNITFIVADRFFPSSKACSNCGVIKKDLKLSDRSYVCVECGMVLDRDLNAAINLASLAKTYIAV